MVVTVPEISRTVSLIFRHFACFVFREDKKERKNNKNNDGIYFGSMLVFAEKNDGLFTSTSEENNVRSM